MRIDLHERIRASTNGIVTMTVDEAKELYDDLRNEVTRRQSAEWRASQRWAMRKEVEELLGFSDGETYDPGKFEEAVARLRALKAAAEHGDPQGKA